jgi:RNA 3'-terminal phosphate cyclase (GTP)
MDEDTDRGATEKTIEIDGSYGEGGGQIIRTALALSTALGKPFKSHSIRKGRKEPGLKSQHLHAINALVELCGAKTSPIALGAVELEYFPRQLKPRTLSIDVGTAGSITLLLQSLWIPLALHGGKFRLKIKGGTDVAWSMPFDYLNEVFVPQLRRYADVDLQLVRRGFYPVGGGEIDITIKGKYCALDSAPPPKLDLVEQGRLVQIKGRSYASSDLQKASVAERQASAAKHILTKFEVPVKIEQAYSESSSPGSGIVLWAIYSRRADEVDVEHPIRIGADCLGERGKRAEIVGEEAAKKLILEMDSGAPVDSCLADNLVPLIAVFGGQMRVANITEHTRTNVYAVNKFLEGTGNSVSIDEERKTIKKD